MPTSDPTGWTCIPVMYRDGSNYKACGDILLEGIITDAQIATLRSHLDADAYYVPGQLGLSHLALEEWPGSSYDDDHNWHEMYPDEIRTSTHAGATPIIEKGTQQAGTVDAFLAKVQGAAAAGWDPSIGNPW